MKVKTMLKAYCVGKASSLSQDGKVTYYNCSISQDDTAGTINCSEDIFNAVERFKEYTFMAEFNDKYGNLRIISVVDTGKGIEKPLVK
ncbi:MAG: hypothetical protein RR238_05205 [Lachnospiraceae bacterium]